MRIDRIALLVSSLLLFVLIAGCLGASTSNEGIIPPADKDFVRELAPYGDLVGNTQLALRVENPETRSLLGAAIDHYNAAIMGISSADNTSADNTFEDHAARFEVVLGALEEHKERLVSVLEYSKTDLFLHPSWATLDEAKQHVEAHHQQVLDTVGKDLADAYQQEINVMDETRRSLGFQMFLYGLPAIPLVAATSWFITHQWEKKHRYWRSFTSKKLFMDPRLPMILLGGLTLAAAVGSLLVLPESRDLLSFLVPR